MFKYLIEKEFKQILRNKTMMLLILLMPTLQLLVLPWAADFEIKNIYLSIVDHDKSDYSQKLIEQFTASPYFKITDISESYAQGLQSIENNIADMILEVPAQFEVNLIQNQPVAVMLNANAINGTKGGLGTAYATNIINSFALKVQQQATLSNSKTVPNPLIEIISNFKYNPLLNYQTFLVPGLLVFLTTLICGLLASLNLVIEKESGTIEQINVTPVKTLWFILAKVAPLWVAGYIVVVVGFLIAFFIYGIVPQGSLWLIALITSFYVVTISSAGLLLSIYSETQQQSMYLSYFFIMIFLLMSGLLTPVSSMPDWAIAITYLNPIRYCIDAMRLIILKGSTFIDIWKDFVAIILFGIGFNVWALMAYKKRK